MFFRKNTAFSKHQKLAFDLFLQPILKQRFRLLRLVLSLVLLSVSLAVVLYAVKWLIPALFGQTNAVHLPPILKSYLNFAISREKLATLVPTVLVLAGVLRALALYLYSLEQQTLVLEWARSYREKLFRVILALPYVRIRERSPGEWMSLLMNDVDFMQNRLTDVLAGVLRSGTQVFTGFAVLFSVHWQSAMGLVFVSPIISFGMGRLGRRIARFAELFQEGLARLSATVLDVRARFDFIRAQGGENLEFERFSRHNLEYFRLTKSSIFLRSLFAPLLELVGFLAFAAFTWSVAHRVLNIEPGELLRFFAALGILLKPLRELGEQISRAQETRGVLRQSIQVFEGLESQTIIPEGIPPLQDSQVSWIKSAIEIKELVVQYRKDLAPSFSAKNLCLVPGSSIAVIGPSGAGKSSVLKVFAGLVKPAVWDASISWEDFKDASSMVSQDPFLFDDSIAENLGYALKDKPTLEEIKKALAIVNIDREVFLAPQGLDARVRAIGSNLSGGQLQRLTIARGLLRSKQIWLLDEATAAIDAKSEKEITTRLIAAACEQKAILFAVTHRLQWLESYDEVWFIEKGSLIYKGKHQDLMQYQRYRQFCSEAL